MRLSHNSKLIAVVANAAFEYVTHPEFFSDLPQIHSFALVSEGGTTGDNPQVREAESAVMMSSATPSPK